MRKACGFLFLLLSLGLVARGFAVRLAGPEEGAGLNPATLDFTVREAGLARGLAHVTRHMALPDTLRVAPWIQSIGASVAVVDVNQDGFVDIFVNSLELGGQNRLFVNDGHGHFSDQAARYGLADLNQASVSIRGVFFDANDDERPDLLLITNDCPRLFLQGADGRFVDQQTNFPPAACGINEAVALADLDRDGRPDLILGGIPFDFRSLRVLPTNVVDAQNGSELTVLLNRGDGRFEASPNLLDAGGRHFFHSVGVGDLRGRGAAELWAAADFTDSKVFLREEEGYRRAPAPFTTARSGMNSEVLYLNGEGPPSVFVTHAYRLGFAVGGNNLWRWAGRNFRDHAREQGVARCGWAWGGKAIDLNNDGLLDLAVANGFISGDPKQDYWFTFSTLISSVQYVTQRFEFWPNMRGRDFSGHERDCLFVNRGDHFENVAAATGFDEEKLDGRAVAAIDADNSGQQHLLVASQNGRLKYYEVGSREPRGWIGFRLRGKRGSREAVGAMVTITAGGKRYRRENYTLNSFAAQSDPRVHFGLGEARTVDAVEVRWPGGETQRFGPMPAGRYYLLEEDKPLAIAHGA